MTRVYPRFLNAVEPAAEAGVESTGAKVARLWENRGGLWTDLAEKDREVTKLSDLIDKAKLSGKDIQETIARDLKPEEFEGLINSQVMYPNVQGQVDDLAARMQRAAEEIRAHPGDYYGGAARDLDTLRETLLKETAGVMESPWGNFHKIFNRLEETKRNLWDLAKPLPSTASMVDRRTQRLVRDVWGSVKEGLESTAVWGEAGARQARLNGALHDFANAEDALDKTMSRWMPDSHGGKRKVLKWESLNRYLNQLGDSRGTEQAEIVGDFFEAFRKLAGEAEESWKAVKSSAYDPKAAEKLIGDLLEQHDIVGARSALTREANTLAGGAGVGYGANVVGGRSSVPELFGTLASGHLLGGPTGAALGAVYGAWRLANDPTRMIQSAITLRAINDSALRGIDWAANRSLYRAGGLAAKGLTTAAIVARFDAQKEQLQSITPDRIAKAVEGPLSYDHPVLASAMAEGLATKTAYLQERMPKSGLGPFGDPRPVSSAEMLKFGRTYDAVNRPLETLKRAAQGESVSREEVQAIEATSPALLREFRSALVRKIAENPPTDPAVIRNLGLLLGVDFTGRAKKARTILALQPMAQAAPVPPAAKPMKPLPSLMTDAQKRQA